MAHIFNVSFRKVGGLRFLKVGRLTVSFSISSRLRTVYTSKPVVERKGEQFAAIVKVYRNGKFTKAVASPDLFADASDAMAHATAGIVACGFKFAK